MPQPSPPVASLVTFFFPRRDSTISSVKLGVHALEGRATPAAYTWTGLDGDGQWETPGNWETAVWVGDGAPVMGVNGYPDDVGDSAYVGFGDVTWNGGQCGGVEVAGGEVECANAVYAQALTVTDGMFKNFGHGSTINDVYQSGGYVGVGGLLGGTAYVPGGYNLAGGRLALTSGSYLVTPTLLAYGGTVEADGSISISGTFVLGGATLDLTVGGGTQQAPFKEFAVGGWQCDGGTIKVRADGRDGADKVYVRHNGVANFVGAPTWAVSYVTPAVPGPAGVATVFVATTWTSSNNYGLTSFWDGYALHKEGDAITFHK